MVSLFASLPLGCLGHRDNLRTATLGRGRRIEMAAQQDDRRLESAAESQRQHVVRRRSALRCTRCRTAAMLPQR